MKHTLLEKDAHGRQDLVSLHTAYTECWIKDSADWQAAYNWCCDSGSDGKFWNYAPFWWFENEQDAMLFILRWVK